MKASALRLGLAAAVLLALGLGSAVAGRSEAVAPAPRPAAAAQADDRVSLVTGGILTPLADGQVIDVAGDLSTTAAFAREPGVRYVRVLTLHLAAGRTPVSDATITVDGHMLTMDHGSFAVAAQRAADGGYVVRLPFVMPGEWQLDVHVARAGVSGDLSLELDELD